MFDLTLCRIECKKLAAHKLHWNEDPRFRLDMGKLLKLMVAGRWPVTGKMYGSEPPKIVSVQFVVDIKYNLYSLLGQYLAEFSEERKLGNFYFQAV